MTRVASFLAAVALLTTAVAPAGARRASGPPTGTYTCTVGAYQQVTGTLRIFTKHRYAFRKSRIGRFTVSGKTLTFRTGAFHKKFSARWHRTSAGKAEILLTKAGRKSASQFCDRG